MSDFTLVVRMIIQNPNLYSYMNIALLSALISFVIIWITHRLLDFGASWKAALASSLFVWVLVLFFLCLRDQILSM